MKKLLLLAVLLPFIAAAQTSVTFSLANGQMNVAPFTNVEVILQQEGVNFNGTVTLLGEPIYQWTGTNAQTTFANLQTSASGPGFYHWIVPANSTPNGPTYTYQGDIQINSTNLGTIANTACAVVLGVSTWPPGSQSAWSAQTSDLRYAAIGSGNTNSGTPVAAGNGLTSTMTGGTNVIAIGGSVVTNQTEWLLFTNLTAYHGGQWYSFPNSLTAGIQEIFNLSPGPVSNNIANSVDIRFADNSAYWTYANIIISNQSFHWTGGGMTSTRLIMAPPTNQWDMNFVMTNTGCQYGVSYEANIWRIGLIQIGTTPFGQTQSIPTDITISGMSLESATNWPCAILSGSAVALTIDNVAFLTTYCYSALVGNSWLAPFALNQAPSVLGTAVNCYTRFSTSHTFMDGLAVGIMDVGNDIQESRFERAFNIGVMTTGLTNAYPLTNFLSLGAAWVSGGNAYAPFDCEGFIPYNNQADILICNNGHIKDYAPQNSWSEVLVLPPAGSVSTVEIDKVSNEISVQVAIQDNGGPFYVTNCASQTNPSPNYGAVSVVSSTVDTDSQFAETHMLNEVAEWGWVDQFDYLNNPEFWISGTMPLNANLSNSTNLPGTSLMGNIVANRGSLFMGNGSGLTNLSATASYFTNTGTISLANGVLALNTNRFVGGGTTYTNTSNAAGFISGNGIGTNVLLGQLPSSVLTNAAALQATNNNLTTLATLNGGNLTNLQSSALTGTISLSQLPSAVLTNSAAFQPTNSALTTLSTLNGSGLTNLSAANLVAGNTTLSNNWVGTFTGTVLSVSNNITLAGNGSTVNGVGLTNGVITGNGSGLTGVPNLVPGMNFPFNGTAGTSGSIYYLLNNYACGNNPQTVILGPLYPGTYTNNTFYYIYGNILATTNVYVVVQTNVNNGTWGSVYSLTMQGQGSGLGNYYATNDAGAFTIPNNGNAYTFRIIFTNNSAGTIPSIYGGFINNLLIPNR